MHIYHYSVNNINTSDAAPNGWISDLYQYFSRKEIDELLILRQSQVLDLFIVSTQSKNIVKSLDEYLRKHLKNNFRLSDTPQIDNDSIIYFFELIIGKNNDLPSDPRILLKMREEFNLALNEGSVGPILTKMYRQGEIVANNLQRNPFIKKNCIARSEVIFDIARKIAGNLNDFQFICIGSRASEMREVVGIIKGLDTQKKYIYNDKFSEAYQLGIDLGCIPLNKVQVENQVDDNMIIIDFDGFFSKKGSLIIQAAQRNKNFLYIYFDLSGKQSRTKISYPQNLYIQSSEQITGLINSHIKNRREYLKNLDSQLQIEVKSFYAWLYSDERYIFNNIVSADRRMQKVFELLRRIAPSDISVLISGETGTGKELIARAIHDNSLRSNARFVPVNCSAIPETLLEGELFGYEKGAFTGALHSKQGLIEAASGGSLFLDEIGDLPAMIQVKLLRVLQEREILHIGSTKPVKVDIRLVTATNQNLDNLTESGKFRADLYYRVNTVQIKLPALRERKKDIPLLTDFFIKRLNKRNGKQINTISDDVLVRFMSYDWPGNIRELENIIERAFAVSIGEEITVTDLPTRLQSFPIKQQKQDSNSAYSARSLKQNEAERIKDLIVNKNVSLIEAARILGIGRTTLWRKMREFGISRDQ